MIKNSKANSKDVANPSASEQKPAFDLQSLIKETVAATVSEVMKQVLPLLVQKPAEPPKPASLPQRSLYDVLNDPTLSEFEKRSYYFKIIGGVPGSF
jgi:hypothetical protein